MAPQYFGPYQIIQKIGAVAYNLQLPPDSRVHSTFHVSLLKLCPNPGVMQRHPPIDFPEVPNVMEPEKVLRKRSINRRKKLITEVLVQWKRLSDIEATWVPLYKMQQQYPTFVFDNP